MKAAKTYLNCLVVCIMLVIFWQQAIKYDRESEQVTDLPAAEIHTAKIQTDERKGTAEEQVTELPPKVALTFDDGPSVLYTGKLLDGLLERQVKVTFFLVGKNIPGNEELVSRMEEEGHLIGNHTYSHVKITNLCEEDACEEILKTSELVEDITGRPIEYVRPPFGEWNQSIECGITLFPVLWTVDTLDWTTGNVSEIVRKGTENIEDGDVILMHDCYDTSVEAALQIVDLLKAEGFEFVTVDELILE